MRTAPHIALCSLLLICGCILLFEMVARDDVSGSDREKLMGSLRVEDFPSYLAYAEAVAQKKADKHLSAGTARSTYRKNSITQDTRRRSAPFQSD